MLVIALKDDTDTGIIVVSVQLERQAILVQRKRAGVSLMLVIAQKDDTDTGITAVSVQQERQVSLVQRR